MPPRTPAELRRMRVDVALEANGLAGLSRERALRAIRHAQQASEARVRVFRLDREIQPREAEQRIEAQRREAQQVREAQRRDARAARVAQQVREARLRVVRAAREAREWAREDRERPRRSTRNELGFFLYRATILLACICLLRFQQPFFSNHTIIFLLQDAFPEISITARDVEVLFRATCRNHTSWVVEICHMDDFEQRTTAWGLLGIMRAEAMINYLPQLTREYFHDRRYGIRYLQYYLVGVSIEEVDRILIGQRRP